MNNRRQNPLEEEFRSSKLYQTLQGSGSYVADKIAEGLGKAAEGIDRAVSSAPSYQNKQPPSPGNYYPSGQTPPASGQPGPGSQSSGQGYYRYPGGNTGPAPSGSPGQSGGYRPPVTPQYARKAQQSAQKAAARAATKAAKAAYRGAPPYVAAQTGAPGVTPRQNPIPNGVTPVAPPAMKFVRKPSVARFYITGVTALLYALMAPMYEPAHFMVFAIVEVLIFLLSSAIFQKKEWVPLEEKKPEEKPKKEPEKEQTEKSTGDPEVDKIIRDGREYLKQLRAANDAIPDESMSADIARMERASSDIFSYISDHPEKSSQIRKFMNYYLPTTLKLLNSYRRLSAQNVKGENVTSTMFNIAGMMHTVADAFEKQLDSLFGDVAMDISADITVFETLLKQEGYVDDKETKTTK